MGEGHSSPIAAAGRVFVFSREQEREVAAALDPATGKPAWRESYAAPYTMNPAATRHGKGPKSTPLFYDGKLFTLGIDGVLTARDAATGKQLWQKTFGSPLYGAAASLAADRGVVIGHVGKHDAGALTAFEPATGDIRWRWPGDGPGYASPIMAELDGVRQVITETQKLIVGVEARSGRLLWQIPFTTNFDQNAVTPLLWRDILILSGLGNGVMGVRASRSSTERLWHTREVSMYMSSPVAMGDVVFGFSHLNRGQLFALDPQTGRVLWTGEPLQGDNAALVAAGDHLLVLTSDAQLTVARVTPRGIEPMRRYTVADSPAWAHPLVTPGGVIVKDANTLAFWSV